MKHLDILLPLLNKQWESDTDDLAEMKVISTMLENAINIQIRGKDGFEFIDKTITDKEYESLFDGTLDELKKTFLFLRVLFLRGVLADESKLADFFKAIAKKVKKGGSIALTASTANANNDEAGLIRWALLMVRYEVLNQSQH